MNIENLSEGQIFKNYKALCEALGIKPTTGKSKQIQMENLNELIDYHKEGNKIIIDKIKVVTEDGQNCVLNSNNYNTQKNPTLVTNNCMKLENLYEGQFIPNYKELCRILEIKPTTSKAKEKQLADLSTYVDFVRGVNRNGKKGNGFMINTILSTEYVPLEKEYKYYNDVRDIFLSYWLTNNISNYYYKKDLFCIADICSMTYFDNRDNKEFYAKSMNMNADTVEDFFNISDRKLTDIIYRSLNKMFDVGLLSKFEKSYQVVVEEEDENGDIVKEYRPAYEDEVGEIGYAIYRALESFNNMYWVRGFGENAVKYYPNPRKSIYEIPKEEVKDFTDYTMQLLQESCPHIKKYYPCFLIKFNHKSCNRYLATHDIDGDSSKKLSNTVFNSLLKTFERNSFLAENGKCPRSAKKYEKSRIENKEDYNKLTEDNIKL